MSNPKQSGPAQADKIEKPENDRAPGRSSDQKRDSKKQDDDIPGAEGPLSAGANEDTYD